MGVRTGKPRGRPKGAPNKVTAKREAEIANAGLTPLAYMLSILRDTQASPEDRKWAAQQAAPYSHARLAAIDANVQANVSLYDWMLDADEDDA